MGKLVYHKVVANYSSDLGTNIKTFDWEWDSVEFMEGKDEKL